MAEQYDVAAWRHQSTADLLFSHQQLDDAGYHYGVVGENALKHALRASGIEAMWLTNSGRRSGRQQRRGGDPLRGTPMRTHYPQLKSLVTQAQAAISIFAIGRLAGTLQAEMMKPSFQNRFDQWDINIRYAETGCTPVTQVICERWRSDAADLILSLVI